MIKEVLFGTLGGLGIFLYGMKLMSDGLKRISGEKLKRVLSVLTKNRFSAVLVGAGFTALIQSSSAMTVMAVGLVTICLSRYRDRFLDDLYRKTPFGEELGRGASGIRIDFSWAVGIKRKFRPPARQRVY
jgi:hypothetical protein